MRTDIYGLTQLKYDELSSISGLVVDDHFNENEGVYYVAISTKALVIVYNGIINIHHNDSLITLKSNDYTAIKIM